MNAQVSNGFEALPAIWPNGWTEDALRAAVLEEVNNGPRAPYTNIINYSHLDRASPLVHTVMRLIAEHREPPVDPLLVEARQIAASNQRFASIRDEVLGGEYDDSTNVQSALAGLKRGIEIGANPR